MDANLGSFDLCNDHATMVHRHCNMQGNVTKDLDLMPALISVSHFIKTILTMYPPCDHCNDLAGREYGRWVGDHRHFSVTH